MQAVLDVVSPRLVIAPSSRKRRQFGGPNGFKLTHIGSKSSHGLGRHRFNRAVIGAELRSL